MPSSSDGWWWRRLAVEAIPKTTPEDSPLSQQQDFAADQGFAFEPI
ncbi:MAG TPA: hypothetical protein V6C90_09840 [Coleofasciculaceae cyanobacterium]